MAHTHLGRAVKNIEPPRPLKSQSRSSLKNSYLVIDDLIQLIENVALGLQSCNTTAESITLLLHNLRVHGPQLEAVSKDTLDRAFVVFRNASQDERLNIMTRLKLLELIELRAKSWEDNDTIAYYKAKQQVSNVELPAEQYQHDAGPQAFLSTSPTFGVGGLGMGTGAAATPGNAAFAVASAAAAAQAAAIAAVGSPNQQHMLLPPGEVIRNSGKFPKPTKIPGKTYCKDEVVIRNADSGKVMGIKGRRVHMIEELSETIISFQRVSPGAKERLVQITGPAEDKINYAKQLMEDTIRRNASPVRLEPAPAAGGSCSSLNSSNSDDANVQVRTPSAGNSSLANRLSFNSAQNFMTASAAAQQISQHQQQVANIAVNPATAAAGKVLRSNHQLLMHSYSTNDASVGEYKFTVNVGQHLIKITGDCCELVRVAKLVLDDYFSSSEFLASMEAGAAFDGNSMVSPVTTPSTPLPGAGQPQFVVVGGNPLRTAGTPLADSGVSLNYVFAPAYNNGDGDDEVFADASANTSNQNGLARSRRSHFSRKESTPENKAAREKVDLDESAGSTLKTTATRLSYDIEHLIYYSKSPHAWSLPLEWNKIVDTAPSIIRNKVIPTLEKHYHNNASCADITHAHNNTSATFSNNVHNAQGYNASSIVPVTNKHQKNITVFIDNNNKNNACERKVVAHENTREEGGRRSHNQNREISEEGWKKTPPVEKDRKLYNKQLQIISHTMEESAIKNKQQAKVIFKRYSENDELVIVADDEQLVSKSIEMNNNRTVI